MLYATLAALVVGVGLQPLVVRLMTSAAVLDLPSERSSHTVPTPRGGGVAVTAAVVVALSLLPPARVLAVPVLLCAVIGLVEDVRGLPIRSRLLAQVVVGVGTGLLLLSPDLPVAVRVAAVAGVAVWLTAFVNAFNFMDGINGISALCAILAGGVYAVLGARHDLPVLTGAGAVIGVAALTFLPWNAGRARIFLGDVGSYGLGGGLAALAAYAVSHGVAAEAAVAPLAVYLADTGWTLARRMARREAWYRPHRTHVYQRLTDLGWSHQRVALTTTGVAGAVSLCALFATGLTAGPVAGSVAGSVGLVAVRAGLDLLALALLVGYLAAPTVLLARRRRITTAREQEQVKLYV